MRLPLFPLNLVLLPNEELSLHIFEDKYKTMVSDCINKHKDFGVVLKGKGFNHAVGCSAAIIDVFYEYETGEYDITVKGKSRFSIINSNRKNNLLIGNVLILPENKVKPNKLLIENVQDKYLNILLNHNLVKDFDIEMRKSISYDFTKKIILPNKLKQMFIEISNENDRLLFLDNLFDKVITAKNKNSAIAKN